MARREQLTPTGDLLVSFIKLQMRGGPPLFVVVEGAAKLPAESQSFMQFLLSKGAIHIRLRCGGMVHSKSESKMALAGKTHSGPRLICFTARRTARRKW